MQPCPAPAASERRLRVHEAVRELMAEQGLRISMDAVAARVGCSKQTLYSQFGSRQQLMHSVMQERLDMATAELDDGHRDVRTVLLAFATEHLQRLSDPRVVVTCQLLSAEAAQFPEEARALYRDGWDTLQQRLAGWLAAAMRRGQLRHDDAHWAAELLLGMIVGLDFERQRSAVPHRDTTSLRQGWAEFAVDAFLRSFQPPASGDPPDSTISPISKP